MNVPATTQSKPPCSTVDAPPTTVRAHVATSKPPSIGTALIPSTSLPAHPSLPRSARAPVRLQVGGDSYIMTISQATAELASHQPSRAAHIHGVGLEGSSHEGYFGRRERRAATPLLHASRDVAPPRAESGPPPSLMGAAAPPSVMGSLGDVDDRRHRRRRHQGQQQNDQRDQCCDTSHDFSLSSRATMPTSCLFGISAGALEEKKPRAHPRIWKVT